MKEIKPRKNTSYLRGGVLIVLCLMAGFFSACPNSPEIETEIEYVTVTYKTDFATAPDAIKVEKNSELSADLLPVLSYDGYDFDGWYIGSRKITAGHKVSSDITLTAKWNRKIGSSTIQIEIAEYNDIELNCESSKDENGSYVFTVTATQGFISYEWKFLAGNKEQKTQKGYENCIVLKESDFSFGLHTLILYAKDADNKSYSAQMQFAPISEMGKNN